MNDFEKFREYLITRSDVNANTIEYRLKWVREYFSRFGREGMEKKENREVYIKELKQRSFIQDWQVRQALDSLVLYFDGYLKVFHREDGQTTPTFSNDKVTWEVVKLKMDEAIRVRGLSRNTQKNYWHWVKKFKEFHQSIEPADLDSLHAKKFINHLALKVKVASATQNQAFNAVLFFYRNVLYKSLKGLRETHRAKNSSFLPVVFSRSELEIIFNELSGNCLLVAQLLYGCGLRVGEGFSLRIKDIDLDRMNVHVRQAKGAKDRVIRIPDMLKIPLRNQISHVEKVHNQDLAIGLGKVVLPGALENKYTKASLEFGWQWLFPSNSLFVDKQTGQAGRYHIHPSNLQKSLKKVLKTNKINKHGTPHSFRHSFGTHLVESGLDVTTLQKLMGHKDIETTMVYVHIAETGTLRVASPLDFLGKAAFQKSGSPPVYL